MTNEERILEKLDVISILINKNGANIKVLDSRLAHVVAYENECKDSIKELFDKLETLGSEVVKIKGDAKMCEQKHDKEERTKRGMWSGIVTVLTLVFSFAIFVLLAIRTFG